MNHSAGLYKSRSRGKPETDRSTYFSQSSRCHTVALVCDVNSDSRNNTRLGRADEGKEPSGLNKSRTVSLFSASADVGAKDRRLPGHGSKKIYEFPHILSASIPIFLERLSSCQKGSRRNGGSK